MCNPHTPPKGVRYPDAMYCMTALLPYLVDALVPPCEHTFNTWTMDWWYLLLSMTQHP